MRQSAEIESDSRAELTDAPTEEVVHAQDPPPYERIAKFAYLLWQERGCAEGCPEQDWFEAEKRLSGNSDLVNA
jgi:hypothetical protein